MMKNTPKLFSCVIAVFLVVFLTACVSKKQFDNLQLQYDQLEAAFSADQAEIVQLQNKIKVTMLDQVLFPEGGYKLNMYSQSILAKLVPTLTTLKTTTVRIAGYTDNVPIGRGLKRIGISTNLDLSSKRADEVVDFLVNQGVNPQILSAQGYGEQNPVASNNTVEGRAKNRRIEVTLIGTEDNSSSQ
jgi:chemotaxis protein MotB